MTEYRLDAEWSAQALEGENKTLMKDIIEAQTAAYIQDKAAALGITCTVQVEADQAAEYPVPKVVTITGALSREERQALTRQIETDFAIPADQQYYESGGEP